MVLAIHMQIWIKSSTVMQFKNVVPVDKLSYATTVCFNVSTSTSFFTSWVQYASFKINCFEETFVFTKSIIDKQTVL